MTERMPSNTDMKRVSLSGEPSSTNTHPHHTVEAHGCGVDAFLLNVLPALLAHIRAVTPFMECALFSICRFCALCFPRLVIRTLILCTKRPVPGTASKLSCTRRIYPRARFLRVFAHATETKQKKRRNRYTNIDFLQHILPLVRPFVSAVIPV